MTGLSLWFGGLIMIKFIRHCTKAANSSTNLENMAPLTISLTFALCWTNQIYLYEQRDYVKRFFSHLSRRSVRRNEKHASRRKNAIIMAMTDERLRDMLIGFYWLLMVKKTAIQKTRPEVERMVDDFLHDLKKKPPPSETPGKGNEL